MYPLLYRCIFYHIAISFIVLLYHLQFLSCILCPDRIAYPLSSYYRLSLIRFLSCMLYQLLPCVFYNTRFFVPCILYYIVVAFVALVHHLLVTLLLCILYQLFYSVSLITHDIVVAFTMSCLRQAFDTMTLRDLCQTDLIVNTPTELHQVLISCNNRA